MSRPKVLLAALTALLVASACASATASAEFSWSPGWGTFPDKYVGEIPSATWEFGGSSLKCPASTSEGEQTTGWKAMTQTIHFRNCNAGGFKCTSEGAKSGEIVTQPLEGTWVYTNKASHAYGVVFWPKSGVNVTTFSCLGVKGEVRGSVIEAGTKNLNGEKGHYLYFHLVQSHSEQVPNEYEDEAGNKHHASLEISWGGSAYQPLGWNFANNLTMSGEGEIEF